MNKKDLIFYCIVSIHGVWLLLYFYQTNKHTNKQTHKQTHKQTNTQTNKHTNTEKIRCTDAHLFLYDNIYIIIHNIHKYICIF